MTTGEIFFVIFYFVLCFYTISSLIYFSTDFFTRFSPIYHITLFTNLILSIYLLLTLRKKPGRIEKSQSPNQTESIPTQLETINLDPKEDSTDLTIAESESSITQRNKKEEELAELYLDLNRYCKICDLIIVKYYIYQAIKRQTL